MASAYRRKDRPGDPFFWLSYETPDPEAPGGKRRVRQRTNPPTTLRKVALEQLARIQVALDNAPPPSAPTLAEYIEAEWPSILAGRTSSTKVSKYSNMTSRLAPALGHLRLDEITFAKVRTAIEAWREEGLSPDYRNTLLAVLTRVLRHAVSSGAIRAMPLVVPAGEVLRDRPAQLTLEMSTAERRAFLAAFSDREGLERVMGPRVAHEPSRDELAARLRASWPFFVVALEAGLARGDLLGLVWEEVDLEAGVIRRARGKTGVLATPPISALCREALMEVRPKTGEGESPRGTVFVGANTATIARHFALAKKIARIERRLRLHDLRHTFGSRLGAAGHNAFEVRDAMGHSHIVTTSRYVRTNASSIARMRATLDGGDTVSPRDDDTAPKG